MKTQTEVGASVTAIQPPVKGTSDQSRESDFFFKTALVGNDEPSFRTKLFRFVLNVIELDVIFKLSQ